MIELHDPLNDFLSFSKSASGRKEFKSNKTKLSGITDEEWAILKGLSYLLICFDKATVMLNGQKYSTFVSAILVLRKLESNLSNQFMFKFDDVSKMAKQRIYIMNCMVKWIFLKGLYLICTMRECYYLNNMDPLMWWKENHSIFQT